MKSKKGTAFLFFVGFLIILAAAGYLGFKFYLGDAPLVVIKKTPTHLAAQSKFAFSLEAVSGRLSRVKVTLVQGSKFKVILDQQLGDKPGQMPVKNGSNPFDILLEPKKLGMTQGEATLIVQGWGRPIGDFYDGKMSRRELAVTIDTVPPRVDLVSRIIRIRQGGSGLAIYNLSKDATKHGVMVGDIEYPGYSPWQDKPHTGLAYFALAHNQDRNTPFILWAEDAAGNRVKRKMPVRARNTRFRHDTIRLRTRTVNALVAKIPDSDGEQLPEDIKSFIHINETLRKTNNDTLKKAARNTVPKQLWTGKFRRPLGQPRAGFGDQRKYIYNKKVVSHAVHLGADVANVARSPIKAAARGRIIYAKGNGIYGNTIIIDHGLGVASLYSHLSEMRVNTEDMVERGQVIGRSGITGMSLGDHLHFSVMINGIFVNPVEWWDNKWYKDNIRLRFEEASLQPPMDDASPQATKPKKKK